MATTWNAAYQATPADGTSPALGDDRMREIKSSIEERLGNEHLTYNTADLATAGNALLDGMHRQGSAHAWYESGTARVNRVHGGALIAFDAGRLLIDSDTNLLYAWSGTAWLPLIREIVRFSIQGVLGIGTGVIPDIILPYGGTIQKVSARVQTAPTGANLRVDLTKFSAADVEAGSIFDTNDYVEIVAAAMYGTSTDMDAANSILTADQYLRVDIDLVGTIVAGADLTVSVDILVG